MEKEPLENKKAFLEIDKTPKDNKSIGWYSFKADDVTKALNGLLADVKEGWVWSDEFRFFQDLIRKWFPDLTEDIDYYDTDE